MRVVFVHGSVANGAVAWQPVEPLRERFELVIPNRGGYPPGPLLERIDFEEQAEELAPLLGDGAHLVGHSYGAVISLLMAARHPGLVRSLTVSEPPAFRLARGRPEVELLIAELHAFFAAGPYGPAEYLRGFLVIVGSGGTDLPDPLPPDLEQGARAAMVERAPWEAQIPLAELAEAPFPKLVVSGGHHAAFDAVCDVLERNLDAQRAVLPGAGHSLPRAPGYVERLEAFLRSVSK
ncbi:MAG: alpha/beta fold hydrolase [Actinobacteria bacterium]|nr:MAG: alpha/beta fold hydrolase [Actinomycetota bacterium]